MKIYWSPDFKIRTVTPQFKDALGVLSPVGAGAISLAVPVKALALTIIPASSAVVRISKTVEGAAVWEDGAITITGVLELPLQDITFVQVTGASNFFFQVVPAIPGELV